jgi:YVTN family beta-propeller protein
MKIRSVHVYRFSLFTVLAALLFVGSTIAQDSSAMKKGGYHLLQKIEIGGEGGWDYLFADGDAHRLYVSHGVKVEVIDTETNKKVGEIAGLKGVHGIATAAEFGRGYISDGRDSSVVVFDTKTLKTLDTIKVGANPDCVIYDPASKRVFAFNRGASSASAIDAATGKVSAPIDLGGHPEFATSDGKGMVFVNLDDKSEVVAIDSKALTVKAHWTLAPDGEDPTGMAIDTKTHRLFIVCGNKKMVVINYDNGKVVTTAATGDGTDAAGFDPKEKVAFSSNGEGTLTVIKVDSNDKFSVAENVTTMRGARTMTVDTKTHKVYLATAQYGETPAPTKERPRPRPPVLPNSFVVLVFGK